jgi:molybdopterin molybdotransferase
MNFLVLTKEADSEDEHDHLHYHGVDKAERHIRVDEALATLLMRIRPVRPEFAATSDCLYRVLYGDIKLRTDIPPRARSTRDGYALNISEESRTFDVIGDVRIGRSPNIKLKPGQAARVATGSFLPSGANSVAMIEYVNEKVGRIELQRESHIGENILGKGDDLRSGLTILKKGTRLYPHHIALIAESGMKRLRVFRKPSVAFFSTGDELFDPLSGKKRKDGIPDINRPFIASMLREQNVTPKDLGIVRDSFQEIKRKIEQGLKTSDALIISAGSSVGERDYALKAARDIPGVELLVHGVAMRPSSPTGLAIYRGKPFILLPGFPTSAFVSFFVFARAAIQELSGDEAGGLLEPRIRARMLDAYDGRRGIRHFLRVGVSKDNGEYVATIAKPTDAYYTSWLGRANGIAILGEDNSSIAPGDYAEIFLIGDVIGD